MIGLKPETIFARRIQDGFANVVFVRDHGASVFQQHRLAENTHVRFGPRPCDVGAMAGAAAQLGKQILSRSATAVPDDAARLSQASYCAGSMTTTSPIMPECWVPQYSAQNR